MPVNCMGDGGYPAMFMQRRLGPALSVCININIVRQTKELSPFSLHEDLF